MFHNTEGILIKKTLLSGNRLILNVFTKEFGMKTYFTRISKKNRNAFFPLSIIDITAYDNPSKSIHNIKEYTINVPLRSVYQDIFKSNILLFLNEILNQVIKEEEQNEHKYNFLKQELLELENSSNIVNFHLVFLMQLTQIIGIEPQLTENKLYFDLEEGEQVNKIPAHNNFFDETETTLFQILYQHSFGRNENLNFTNQNRKKTLQLLVKYYKYHTDMKDLKSLPVLETIFN